jgi:hypothetical protein
MFQRGSSNIFLVWILVIVRITALFMLSSSLFCADEVVTNTLVNTPNPNVTMPDPISVTKFSFSGTLFDARFGIISGIYRGIRLLKRVPKVLPILGPAVVIGTSVSILAGFYNTGTRSQTSGSFTHSRYPNRPSGLTEVSTSQLSTPSVSQATRPLVGPQNHMITELPLFDSILSYIPNLDISV